MREDKNGDQSYPHEAYTPTWLSSNTDSETEQLISRSATHKLRKLTVFTRQPCVNNDVPATFVDGSTTKTVDVGHPYSAADQDFSYIYFRKIIC